MGFFIEVKITPHKYANKGGWMQNKVQYTRLVKDESVNW